MENPKPSSAHLHSNTKTPRSAKSFNVSLAPDPTNSSYSCPTKCEPLCKSLQVTPGSKGSFSKQSPSSNTGAPRCKGAAPSDCKKPQNETSCDTDITYNPPPGTLILNDVQLPVQYPNFWLISQFGSRGTSKPARYFILRNDQHETINESHIHYFLYQTCHLCCRSTSTTSVPAPTYYAHLLASRGNLLVEELAFRPLETGKNDSVVIAKEGNQKLKEVIMAQSDMFFI
eukprot:GHVT01053386.1.p1 GENE.GHVT01053386.1~~GHVT01053386.1.p1  ORF type:complete len:229 (-),score=13.33 GHVT01053386.1:794-1480(-)